MLRDGDRGRLLAHCWSGCDRLAVLAELRQLGLLDGRSSQCRPPVTAPPREDHAGRTARALAIWRAANPAAEVAAYLRSRGISLEAWPPTLRFHLRCPRPRDDAGNLVPPLPAMVALVEHIERGPVAVHCTYVRPDGGGKADLPKDKQRACFGPVAGGAVRLGRLRAGEWLAVAEGIETALAVAVACAMPAWAALSAGGIRALILPAEATHVIICADHDRSGTGERAAHDAAARWLAEGRRVRIAMPPTLNSDFNDLLRSGRPSWETQRVA